MSVSEGFAGWLHDNRLGLVFSEKESGTLYFVGTSGRGEQIALTKIALPGCSAIWSDGQRLWLATTEHIYGFIKTDKGEGSLFKQFMRVITGPVDIRDMVLDAAGRPIFVAVNGDCLATISYTSEYKKLWQTPRTLLTTVGDGYYVSGMAHDGRRIRYLTYCRNRDARNIYTTSEDNAGFVYDIVEDRVMADGLQLPHSPRYYQNRVWLINGCLSELGVIENKSGNFLVNFSCQGIQTGVSFHGKFALVGISSAVSGDPAAKTVKNNTGSSSYGLVLLDTKTARIVHWLRLTLDNVDVAAVGFLPDTTMPVTLAI